MSVPSSGSSGIRPPLLHAAAVQSESRVANEPSSEGAGGIRIGRVDSASVIGGVAGAEPSAKKQRLEGAPDSKASLVIPGGTGSQGIALAYAASQSYGSHHREILIPVRDEKRASSLEVVVDGKAHKLKDLPGVRFVSPSALKEADGSRMIVIATVPSLALADVLRNLPAKPQGLVATYNGMSPLLPEGMREPEHVVSMIPSFAIPHKPSAFAFRPGALIVGKSSPVASDLTRIFGATFSVQTAVSGPHAQWTKIATNTAANSLATLFGIKVMDLSAKVQGDERAQKLLKGIVAETCMVARREDIEFNVDELYAQVLAKIPPTMDHFTSTGVMFRAGASLTEDIASLSGGVAQGASRELGAHKPRVDTPICSALANSLMKLQNERGQGAMPADFYSRDAVKAIQADLLSPEMLAQADASITRARAAVMVGAEPLAAQAAQLAPAAVMPTGGGGSAGAAVLQSRL